MAGRRIALIIANDVYEHDGLSALRSPAADAAALADVLSDRRISDFAVEVVHNETANAVLHRIDDLFADSRREDVLLLHFSCHGLKNESGELHFAMRDTRPDRLRSTAVSADYAQRCMKASRSRSIVLLLDCCYGGAYGQGVAVRAAGDAHVLDSFSGGRGRAVITASSAMEYAFEGDRLADDQAPLPSVFTAAVVEGLATGAADRDEDGLIGLGELYDYVFEQVRDRNPNQTPSRDVEMQGELYLARSDTRTVVDAVTAALHDVDVRLAETSIHLGPDEVGRIRPLGPPLARACGFSSEQDWIRITVVDGGADLAVTPGEGQARHGTVVVSGPTGRVDVTVVAEPEPPPGSRTRPRIDEPSPGHPAALSAAGALAIVSSLVMTFAVFLGSSHDDTIQHDLPFGKWYFTAMIVLALAGGLAMLLARREPLLTTGFLVGIAATATWGAALVISSLARGDSDPSYPGMWVELAGCALLLVAGGLAAVSARRSGLVGASPHPVDRWLALRAGFAVLSVYSLVTWTARLDVGFVVALSVVPELVALAVQVGSLFLAPRRFALALLCGWAVSTLFVVATLWELATRANTNRSDLLPFLGSVPIALALAVADRVKHHHGHGRQPG